MFRSLRPRLHLAIGVTALILAVPARAGGPARLAADLAQGGVQRPQIFSGFARIGSRSVFIGLDDEDRALWVTDGTAQGTRKVSTSRPTTACTAASCGCCRRTPSRATVRICPFDFS
jgi:ELWxxDGT repeat protein